MKKSLCRVFSAGFLVVLFSTAIFAQERLQTISGAESLYVVSAKAGGVNFVEGKVSLNRKNAKSVDLQKSDELEIGDKVTTAADGKAEILLNPGSFVRLAGNSTFEFASTALENLQIKLTSGSAMFEVITDDEFTFAVNTPKSTFNILKSGVYRVDVLNDGEGRIEVWKGRASANGTEVKSGRQATVSSNQATVTKFDRDGKDALETWSKGRAKMLAKFNSRLENRAVRLSLMSSYYRTRWSLYDSYGLWIYSRAQESFCFMPFGYGWSSPYGFYYYHDIWYYNLPPVIYNPSPPTTTTATVTSAGSTIRGVRPGQASPPSRVEPPFVRVQKDIGQFPVEAPSDGLLSPSNSPSIRYPSPTSAPPTTTSTDMPVVIAPAGMPPRKGVN